MIIGRRNFLIGAGSLLLSPMVVKAEALMPVKNINRFYIRGIIDYNISADSLMLRIDKANFVLSTPKYVAGRISALECQKLLNNFSPHLAQKLEIYSTEKQQKSISANFTPNSFPDLKIEWRDPGPYSDWDIPK